MNRRTSILAFLLVLGTVIGGAGIASAAGGPHPLRTGHASHHHPKAQRANSDEYWQRMPHYQRCAPDWRYYGYYPKYYAGFHARRMQTIGVPNGDVPFRGLPW